MRNRWPTDEEIAQAEEAESQRVLAVEAKLDIAEATDPICDCGEPGWACCCEEIAQSCGYWKNGEPYDERDATEQR